MAKQAKAVDVKVENHAGLFRFIPLTPKAQDCVNGNVEIEDWQWYGGGFAVDGRGYAIDLAEGMQSSGLVVK